MAVGFAVCHHSVQSEMRLWQSVYMVDVQSLMMMMVSWLMASSSL